jgi:Ca2+/H+ antiporter
MWWSIGGALAAVIIAVSAFVRSRSPGGYYDTEVYGMTPAAHRRYATIACIFAIFFVATIVLRARSVAFAGLAAFAIFAVFYLTSFLRGFSDDDV